MKLRTIFGAVALVGLAGFALASCATSGDDSGSNHAGTGGQAGDGAAGGGGTGAVGGSGGSGATTSGGGSGGTTGSGGMSASGGAGGLDGSPSDVTFNYDGPNSGDAFDACANTVVKAQLSPLDMYIMLDRSGSMSEATAAGPTKWNAIKQAITGFLQNSGSTGMGVGIQYFPVNKAGVPASCTTSTQCGSSGPCLLKTCLKPGNPTLTPCDVNSDCGPGATSQCVDLGYCSGNPSIYCAPVGSTACGASGNCVKLASSVCVNADSCTVADYATPAVAIALLPGVATTIINSMNAQTPNGNTPTGPALQGAVNYASTYATAHPSHTVVTVLATDGLPTECTPTAINQIAAIAAAGVAGTPSIQTFVIGVFAATDTTSLGNLNAIASGGGTGTALIVDPTSGNVSTQFLAALQAIQGQTLGCDYQMPTSSSGIIDPTKVTMTVTTSSGTQSVNRVTSASACSGDGWYYDSNANPKKLILCPTTCSKVKGDANPSVNVSLGCLGS